MLAQANKVVEARDDTWQAPPSAGATPTLPGLPDREGTLKLGDASGPGGTLELGDASEPGETNTFPHHRRAVSCDREHGSRDGDDIREGRSRAETRTLNQGAALGLISLIEPDRGSRVFHALLAENATGGEPAKPPDRLVQEAEQTPPADCTTPSPRSRHSGA